MDAGVIVTALGQVAPIEPLFAGAAVVAGACGQSLPAQRWASTGSTLRGGTLCLTAGSGQPAVTVSTCTGDASQAWTVQGTGQFRNAQTGLCLRDARGNHPAGAPLALASCAHTRAKT